MLPRTFIHLPLVGAKKEARLWSQGILSWQDLITASRQPDKPESFVALGDACAQGARRLAAGDYGYFTKRLKASAHWRLFPHLRGRLLYLDIETDGGLSDQPITTIVTYDGHDVHHFVRGQNLGDFPNHVVGCDGIVTFSGRSFDVPVIQRQFGIKMEMAHIDLRWVLKPLGYTGGLKACERRLGLERGALDGVDGYFAVLLWREYQARKNPAALQTLLAYNAEDVINLEALMVKAYNLYLRGTPFERIDEIKRPSLAANPFTADRALIKRLKDGLQNRYPW